LTNEQRAAFAYISALGRFRKTSSAITSGKLMQFIPANGVYTYFRYTDKQTVMVISNTSTISSNPPLKVYEERLKGFTKARDVVSGTVTNLAELILPPGESFVFELIK
jgi:glycosidase